MGWSGSIPLSWALPTTLCSSNFLFKQSCLPVPAFASHELHFPINEEANSDYEVSVIVQRSSINCSRSFWLSRTNKNSRICASQFKVEDITEDETCELVNGVELSIGEGDDAINAYLCTAVKNNNGTGILLLSDVFGFEDSATRDFAYLVACNGYNVLVPDLFRGDPWTKERPKALFEEWRARQNPEHIAKDIFISADWMVNEFVAAGITKKLGIIGFCFGGGQVIDILAHDQGGCFGVGVSFYGTGISTSAAANIRVPVLFIAGDNDPLCPVNNLKDIGKEIEHQKIVVFQGRGHGFVHRPESPEEDEDAEKAFVIMRNWVHDGLAIET
nr:carboxymethylenebutenolidase homolog isoform X3 [Coffea arabica]